MQEDSLSFLNSLLMRIAASMLFSIAVCSVAIMAQEKHPEELQIQKNWEYRLEGGVDGRMATDGENIFIVRDGSAIIAISSESGKRIWSSDIGGTVDSNLIVAGGNVIFVRRSIAVDRVKGESAVILALSSSTGITRWKSFAVGEKAFRLGISGGDVVSVSGNGAVQANAITDGAERWKKQLNADSNVVTFSQDDDVLVVADGNSIRSIGANGGDADTILTSKHKVSAVDLSSGSLIYWGDDRGNLTLSSIALNKRIWSFKSGGSISEIIEINGTLIAASYDNFVYALTPSNGSRIWKRRISGRISSMIKFNEEMLLIRPAGVENLLLLEVDNGKVLGQINVEEKASARAAIVLPASRIGVLTDETVSSYTVGPKPVTNENGPSIKPPGR